MGLIQDFNNEEKVIDIILDTLKPKSRKFAFIDCGANTGVFSSLLIKKLRIDYYAYLIEPNITLNEKIKESFKGLNGDYKIINLVCGAKKGKVEFNISNDNTVSSMLKVEPTLKQISSAYQLNKVVQVNMDTLDNLFLNVSKIDFLKIDAQGYDLEVLFGAKEILKKNKITSVLVEFGVALQYQKQFKLHQLLNFMDEMGYMLHSFCRLVHTEKGHLYFGDTFFVSSVFCKENNWLGF